MTIQSKHIIVGLSGGVDSAVAAFLLKEAGHHVEGVFMKNWEEDDHSVYCSAEKDIEDAKSVASTLNIPFTVINFADAYWERVFVYFLESYRKGDTPNPDILCNKEIKFSAFLDYAQKRGADGIATGHYANLLNQNSHTTLLKAADLQKDQTYFLHALSEIQLAQSHFPIGSMQKPEVRKLAQTLGFKNHDKKDSTGICFIGERKFKAFLSQYLLAEPGWIITIDGTKIGRHTGLIYHTIGQRQGLNIGGQQGSTHEPWYVVAKCLKNNELIVAQGKDHPALFKKELTVTDMHWINAIKPSFPLKLKAKIRYRQIEQICTVHLRNENKLFVEFDEPQRAVTPGQFIVFYQDNICLGGGKIEYLSTGA